MKLKILIISLIVSIMYACSDSDDGGKDTLGTLSVRLTDAPANYEEVLVDVQGLEININNDDESGWQEVPLEVTGQLDLLGLTNGKDTLLAEEDFPAGKISQMRLILGYNNKVKVDGKYHDLATPSAQQSGLKFNINATLEPGIKYTLWIDFDAAKSIVEKGNGRYSLKPVIKVFTEATSGSIHGRAVPLDAMAWIHAISTTNDTTSTLANEETGLFTIRGLEEGYYKVVFEPQNEEYQQSERTGVGVTNGNITDVGDIILSQ